MNWTAEKLFAVLVMILVVGLLLISLYGIALEDKGRERMHELKLKECEKNESKTTTG